MYEPIPVPPPSLLLPQPPGLIKSLVFGLLLIYFLQNTLREDFRKMTYLLLNRMLARGHTTERLRTVFVETT